MHWLTSDTHRDTDTARRQMQKLRAGGFLHCPRQQRATENAQFNPYIYDLTPRARAFLDEEGLAEDTIRPTGHWVHQYMTACITGAIDIAAARAAVSFIAGHRVLARSRASLGIDLDRKTLIPDQLFGLDYGGQYRFFCVEADRGTEPKTSSQARKSHRAMLEDYRSFIGGKRYKAHYCLTAGMLLLVVFSSRTNETRFLKAAREVLGERRGYVMTQVVGEFHGAFRPPLRLDRLFLGPWKRADLPDFRISELEDR